MRAPVLSMALPLVITLAMTAPALAQTAATPDTAPARISVGGSGETILNIAATERAQVPQDLLIASLRIEKEDADAKIVQKAINDAMTAAMASAKAVPSVKASTGQYYVYQYDPNPIPVHERKAGEKSQATWRGSQTIELQSTAADDLLNLAGALQEAGLVMNGLTYSLSPEKADEAKDQMMEAALAKVKTRAERAAAAMSKTKTELIEVSVDAADMPMPQPMMMRAMAMDGAMEKSATPVAEPGDTEITLTVTARALLK